MSSWLKIGQWITKGVYVVASVGMLIIMTAVTVNVIGRAFFGMPLLGTVEIVGMAGVLLVPFAFVITEQKRAHIVVEMLTSRLSERTQSIIAVPVLLLCLFAVVLLIWGGVEQCRDCLTRPDMVTPVLRISKAPFVSVWVVGCLFLVGYLMQHLVEILSKAGKK